MKHCVFSVDIHNEHYFVLAHIPVQANVVHIFVNLQKWLSEKLNDLKVFGTINKVKLGDLVGSLKYFRCTALFAPLDISAAEYIKLEITPTQHGFDNDDVPVRPSGVHFGDLNQFIYYYTINDFEHEQVSYPIFIYLPIVMEIHEFFPLLIEHFGEYIGKLRKQLTIPSIQYKDWAIHMKFFDAQNHP